MSNFSATLPNPRVAAVNAALGELGFGPNNFSVPVRKNPNAQPTHMGLHCWNDPALLQALIELNEPGVQITVNEPDENGEGQVQGPNFNAHLAATGMVRHIEPEQ